MSQHDNEAPELLRRIAGLSLTGWTTPLTILRGRRYLEQARVGPLLLRPNELVTAVQGSAPQPYCVYFIEGVDGLIALCECPFDRDPFCKHIVAVVLACGEALAGRIQWRQEPGPLPLERIRATLAVLPGLRQRLDRFKALELCGHLILHDLGRAELEPRQRLDLAAAALEQTLDVLLFAESPSAWPLDCVRSLVRWCLAQSEAMDRPLSEFLGRLFSLDSRMARELTPALVAACYGPEHCRRLAQALTGCRRGPAAADPQSRAALEQLINRLQSESWK